MTSHPRCRVSATPLFPPNQLTTTTTSTIVVGSLSPLQHEIESSKGDENGKRKSSSNKRIWSWLYQRRQIVFCILCLMVSFRLFLSLSGFPWRNSPTSNRYLWIPRVRTWIFFDSLRDHCRALFGNGFTEQFDICSVDSSLTNRNHKETSRITCSWNPKTRSSLCQGHNIRVNPHKIRVSAGGEEIQQVLQRREDLEFPKYQPGAFAPLYPCRGPDPTMLSPGRLPHHLFDAMNCVIPYQQNATDCQTFVQRPALFVTRYEYANLYHSLTDWYNAYQAANIGLLQNTDFVLPNGEMSSSSPFIHNYTLADVMVVFWDGHARGALDDVWTVLFPRSKRMHYVSQLKLACFRHIIWVPAGYRSALSDNTMGDLRSRECRGGEINPWLNQFRSWMTTAQDLQLLDETYRQQSQNMETDRASPIMTLPATTTQKEKNRIIKILWISRTDYVAHPRQVWPPKADRKVANEDEILQTLLQSIQRQPKYRDYDIQIHHIHLEHETFARQVHAFATSDVIVGVHGAGLSHVLWCSNSSILLELALSSSTFFHFEFLAGWAGLRYRRVRLPGSISSVDPDKGYFVPVDSLVLAILEAVDEWIAHNREQRRAWNSHTTSFF